MSFTVCAKSMSSVSFFIKINILFRLSLFSEYPLYVVRLPLTFLFEVFNYLMKTFVKNTVIRIVKTNVLYW